MTGARMRSGLRGSFAVRSREPGSGTPSLRPQPGEERARCVASCRRASSRVLGSWRSSSTVGGVSIWALKQRMLLLTTATGNSTTGSYDCHSHGKCLCGCGFGIGGQVGLGGAVWLEAVGVEELLGGVVVMVWVLVMASLVSSLVIAGVSGPGYSLAGARRRILVMVSKALTPRVSSRRTVVVRCLGLRRDRLWWWL
jgi:hypothetical protein